MPRSRGAHSMRGEGPAGSVRRGPFLYIRCVMALWGPFLCPQVYMLACVTGLSVGEENGMDASIAAGVQLNDGYKIPRIAFGTYSLGDECATQEAVETALEMGYRHLDCARFYGNEKGVGAGIASTGLPREEVFVTSKVWNDRQLDGTVRESVEESLRDLQVDYLDLLLIHWPVEGKFLLTWEQFIEIRDEGLVKSIGVSNHLPKQIDTLVRETGVVPAVEQIERHPYRHAGESFDYCREQGIAVEAWSPLGRGGCLKDPVICDIAKNRGISPAQVILAWHKACGVVPLPRSNKPQNIKANLAAMDVTLTDAELARIDALDAGKTVSEGIDPEHFGAYLNNLSSHF